MLELERLVVKLGVDAGQFFGGLGGVEARLVGFGLAAAGIVGRMAVRLGSDLEQVSLGFEVMTGSAEKAKSLLQSIKDFAITSPFQTLELAKQSQRLLAYGVSANSVLPVIQRLSSVATAVGSGAEGLDRLAYAFGQVISAGRFMGTELRQFAEAGIGAKDFADVLGITTGRFRELMSEGKIGPEVMVEAFNRMTSQGGRFFGMVERGAKTAAGRFNAIKESTQLGFGEAAGKFLKQMEDGGGFRQLAETAERFQKALSDLTPGDFAGAVDGIKDTVLAIEQSTKNISSLWADISKATGQTMEELGYDAREQVSIWETIRVTMVALPGALEDAMNTLRALVYTISLGLLDMFDSTLQFGEKVLYDVSLGAFGDGQPGEKFQTAKDVLGELAVNAANNLGKTEEAIKRFYMEKFKNPAGEKPIPDPDKIPRVMNFLGNEITKFVDGVAENAKKMGVAGEDWEKNLFRLIRASELGLLKDDAFALGAGEIFDKLRSRTKPKEFKTPDAVFAGSKEAQEIINRSVFDQQNAKDKRQEIIDLLKENQRMDMETAKDRRAIVEILKDLRDRGLLQRGRI